MSEEKRLEQGTVFKKSLGQYFVHRGDEVVVCAITNRLRKQLVYPTSSPFSGTLRRVQKVKEIKVVDPVAIGDQVEYELGEGGEGVIRGVLPRKNQLVRGAAGTDKKAQVIAANIDQVLAIIAVAEPRPNWGLVDRFLVACEAEGLPVRMVLTKMDLVADKQVERVAKIYRRLDYSVLLTSADSGRNVDQFRGWITGKVSVLVGMSGVGKTSLLNAVQPELGLQVKTISESTGKGRHTTTHLEMFPLEGGGYLVDTPGVKVFDFKELPGQIMAQFFREMQPFIGQCRFRTDCSHTHEPDCAIKAAVEAGQIAQMRYKSFVRLSR